MEPRTRAGAPGGRKPAAAARRPLAWFRVSADGRFYRLDPDALIAQCWAGVPGGRPDPGAIRARLDPARLGAVDDAALAAAARGGITSTPAFLDIIDDNLVRAACLCCYHTCDRGRAEEVEDQVRALLRYYRQESFEGSNAFYRALDGMSRDVPPGETDALLRHAAQGPRGGEAPDSREGAARAGARALNSRPGVCALHTFHPPRGDEEGLLARAGVQLWMYSTPEGRKLLRRLSKACKEAGLSLKAALVAGDDFLRLRHKHRAYAVECYGEGRAEDFWALVRRACRGAEIEAAPVQGMTGGDVNLRESSRAGAGLGGGGPRPEGAARRL